MQTIRHLCVFMLMLLLGGCAVFAPPKPLVDETEVLATRGEPSTIWENRDGTRTFEYATQPYGTTAWMYTIDPHGKVVAQYDALSASNLGRVKPGMANAEVRRLLGQERSIQRFALSGEEVWDWNVEREYPGIVASRFNVHFIDGKVERTSMTHIYPEADWRFGIGIGRGVGSFWGIGMGWPYHYPGAYPYGPFGW